jgi:site-specific DNA recombinase
LRQRELQRATGQHDISLAFLAPNLVKAAIEGRLLRGIGIERLRDLPSEWSQQFEVLGLNPE